MVGRLLAKLGVASSTITGVVYLDTVPANSFRVKSKEETKEITEDLKTIEDIELFERVYGCNFVFVNHWDNKLLYSARAFKEKNNDWETGIINVANTPKAKEICKNQRGTVTLFDKPDKSFRLGEPDNKQW